MNRFEYQWQKLVAAARQAPDDRDITAPFGFAGRMAAQAAGSRVAAPWAALERFALRGFLAAAACCVAAVAFNVLNRPGESAIDVLEDTVNSAAELS